MPLQPTPYEMTLKRLYILTALCTIFWGLCNGANPEPVLRALLPDSVRADRAATIVYLDSLASGSTENAEVAAGMSLMLRGESEIGFRTLTVALENARTQSAVWSSLADYLIAIEYGKGSSSTQYQRLLEIKADYMARIDSLCADVFIELARKNIANGDNAEAIRNLGIALSGCTAPDSSQLRQIASLYEAAASGSGRNQAAMWLWIVSGAAVAATAAIIYKSRKQSAPADIESPVPDTATRHDPARAMLALALFASDKNRDFCLLVERKLAAGQSKDLYSTVNSGKYFTNYRNSFLEEFDKTFLAAYPEFPAHINAQLKPDSQLKFEAKLTPEERIAAMISLGISGSPELADALGLSLNTVYTYRNRLKGRAAERTVFEEKLRNWRQDG